MSNIPKLRFPEFTDAWEKCKLGEIATINPKSTLPQTFNYVDLESVVGTEMRSYKIEKLYSAPSRAQRLAKYGDIFYQTVRPYQKNNYLFELDDENYVFSTGYAQIRSKIYPYFLFTLIQNDRFVNEVLDNCTGTSYPAINATDLKNITIFISNNPIEQQKIGNLFKQLDRLITLHKRKWDDVILLKKALLQKMFPKNGSDFPEIRFPEFTDAWEKCKLGEVAKRVKGNDGDMSLPTLTISAGSGWLDQKDRFSGNIAGSEQKNYTLLKRGQLSYNHGNSKLAKYGAVFVLRTYEKALVPRVYHSFTMLNNADADFIEFLFATKIPDKELVKKITSGARTDGLLNISFEGFMDIAITIPTLPEQQKIGNLFKQLDRLITLHKRQHEHYQLLKKALLQQMFV